MTEAGRALSLLAHPDDAEFLCAGTLALLAARGWRVTIATATPGDCGSAVLPPDEIAAIRREEACRAAARIGAEYLCLDQRDLAIDYDTTTRRLFTAALRSVRPQIVFTHPLADYMADHEIVGRLTRDACFSGPMPNFQAPGKAAPLDHIPALYYCMPFQPESGGSPADLASQPALSVDVTSVMTTKRTMLADHASQREWLRKQHGVDEYLRLQEGIARRSGEYSGFEYAELFVQHLGHPYPAEDILARALGQEEAPEETV